MAVFAVDEVCVQSVESCCDCRMLLFIQLDIAPCPFPSCDNSACLVMIEYVLRNNSASERHFKTEHRRGAMMHNLLNQQAGATCWLSAAHCRQVRQNLLQLQGSLLGCSTRWHNLCSCA